MFYKRIGKFYPRSGAYLQIAIPLCFTCGNAASLPCKGERWHCNFAIFYKRNGTPPLGVLFFDRRNSLGVIIEMKGCEGPISLRHIQKCMISLCFTNEMQWQRGVFSPRQTKSARFYKRNGGLWRGHFIAIRSKTRPIRYVLQAE